MKKIIINRILGIKNKLPEKYQFVFIGLLSYVYSRFLMVSDCIDYIRHANDYEKFVSKIKSDGKRTFVFLYTTDFNDIQQRPQHLANAFSKLGNCTVFFMTKNQTKDNVRGIQKVNENLFLVGNYKIINLLKEYNLIITGPSNFAFVNKLKNFDKLIYDFPDELDFFPGLSRKVIERYHKALLEMADLVTPSADYLEKIVKVDYGKARTRVILNGVFPADFNIPEKDLTFIPEDLLQFIGKGKIVGFYGGLGEGWFDFKLLKYSAQQKSDYNFIIIGGGNIEYIKNKYSFKEVGNVHFFGPRNYTDLKHYAKHFNVALIPFQLNQLTLGVSPIKSFEYMVQGIPFVSTGLPECRKYKNVLIGENYEDFVQKIDDGIQLKQNPKYIEELKKEGNENSWLNRAELIINALKDDGNDR